MAILVTGGAGYIGSHMAHALMERGETVVVLDNLATGVRMDRAACATFVRGRHRRPEAGRAGSSASTPSPRSSISPDRSVVPDSVADPLAYYRNNTAKSRDLLEAAVTGGVERFIFSSTAAVYGQPDSVPVVEEAELKPMSPYGRSKLMTEWMLRDTAAATGLAYVGAALFQCCGSRSQGADRPVDAARHPSDQGRLRDGGRQRGRISTYSARDYPTADGTCVRDYIHVSDLIAAHDAALGHLRGGGANGIFNCGYGRGYSVLDVVAAMERATGRPLPVRDAARRPGDPPAIVAGAERARQVLGWSPRHDDLDLIVASALAWERRLRQRNA